MALVRIQDLPAATLPLDGTELIEIEQGGVSSQATISDITAGVGAVDFTDLADVPASYTGAAGQAVVVNATEDGLEFIAVSGTGTVTSVGVSGGTTGLTTSGGPVTTAGTITLSGTLAAANGGTGVTSLSALLTAQQGTGLDADAAGFRGIPQNSQSGNYTTVASDAGKEIYHPSGAGAGDTFTIDSNANVAYEIGTAITFTNMDSNNLSIAITSDTLTLAGAGTTGTRTLAQYGTATAVKKTSTLWLISGIGLT